MVNILQKISIVMLLVLIFLLMESPLALAKGVGKNASSQKASNANQYDFPSDLKFYHEDTFADKTTEAFSLYSNKDVKLIISMYPGKSLYQKTKNLSKNEISSGFLSANQEMDEIRQILNRKVTDLQTQDDGQAIKIFTTYNFQKNDQNYVEKTVYLVGANDLATAAISYPDNQSQEIRDLIDQGVKSFSFKNTKHANYQVDTDAGLGFAQVTIDFNVNNVVSKFLSSSKIQSISAMTSTANAEEATAIDCSKEITVSDYVVSGQHQANDGGKGKALYNFELIKEGVLSSDNSDNKKHCLKQLFVEARQNSKKYWDHIFDSKCESSSEQDQIQCPDSIASEYKRSTEYLDSIQKKMSTALEKMEGKVCTDCEKEATAVRPAIQQAAAVLAKNSCCSKGGPLSNFLKQTEEITNENELQKQCLAKSSKTDKAVFSSDGLYECGKNALLGVKDLWIAAKGAWSGFTSLFDFETWKSAAQFVVDQKDWSDFGNKLVDLLSQSIKDEYQSVFSCMNSYAQKQYMCRVTTQTITAFISGVGIIKLVKLLKKPATFIAEAKKIMSAKSTLKAATAKTSIGTKVKQSAVKLAAGTKVVASSVNAKFRAVVTKPFSKEFKQVVSSTEVKTTTTARQKAVDLAEHDLERSREKLVEFDKRNNSKLTNIEARQTEIAEKLNKHNLDAHDTAAFKTEAKLLEKRTSAIQEKREKLQNDFDEKARWAEKMEPNSDKLKRQAGKKESKPNKTSTSEKTGDETKQLNSKENKNATTGDVEASAKPEAKKTLRQKHTETAEHDLQASRQRLIDFDSKNKDNIAKLTKDQTDVDQAISKLPDGDPEKIKLQQKKEALNRVRQSFDDDRKKLEADFIDKANWVEKIESKPDAMKRKSQGQ